MIIVCVMLLRGIGSIQKVRAYAFKGIFEATKGNHVS